MSGILQDGMLGDKEIAVRIRSNSHYRISCGNTSPVGMLIALRSVKVSWAIGEIVTVYGGSIRSDRSLAEQAAKV